MDIKIKKTDPKNLKKLISPCKICKRESNQSILDQYEKHGDDGEFWWTEFFQVLKCEGCDEVSFRKSETNSESLYQVDHNEWDYDEIINVYPNPLQTRHPITELHFLPSKIRTIYKETIKSLNESQPILAGIGIRAIVETICKDMDSPGNNLFEKIDGLVSMDALTSENSKILHKVRTLGNDAAHEVKPHKESELGVAMTVVEHLISQLYVLPKLAEATFD